MGVFTCQCGKGSRWLASSSWVAWKCSLQHSILQHGSLTVSRVCNTSVLSLISFHCMTLLNVPEGDWYPVFWSTGEVSLGIISACLPILWPLLPMNVWQSLGSGGSRSRSRRSGSSSGVPSASYGGRPPTTSHARRMQHGSTLSTDTLTDEHTVLESSERAASDSLSMASECKGPLDGVCPRGSAENDIWANIWFYYKGGFNCLMSW